MLMYVDELMYQLDSIEEYARIVLEKFEAGRPCNELLLDTRALSSRCENIQTMLPDGISTGNLGRHIGFMIRYLEKDEISSCSGDIHDIVNYDLPAIRESIKKWSHSLAYLDSGLRTSLAPLIRTRQFDSAIRKAFVVLKTRMCHKFGVDEKVDGPVLVNQIFGVKSQTLQMDAGEKQAYRDFFAGLFGLMRNSYAHNDVDASISELEAVVSAVNLGLRLIGDFRK